MPAFGRPSRITGPILSPRASSATSFERVRSGPDSPPAASRPWQNPHWAENWASPALIWSAEYVWAVAGLGRGGDAGLWIGGRGGLPGGAWAIAMPPPIRAAQNTGNAFFLARRSMWSRYQHFTLCIRKPSTVVQPAEQPLTSKGQNHKIRRNSAIALGSGWTAG